MKTWFGYYISASKMFVAKWFRTLKIIFSKLGNCTSILAIVFNLYEKITRS